MTIPAQLIAAMARSDAIRKEWKAASEAEYVLRLARQDAADHVECLKNDLMKELEEEAQKVSA